MNIAMPMQNRNDALKVMRWLADEFGYSHNTVRAALGLKTSSLVEEKKNFSKQKNSALLI